MGSELDNEGRVEICQRGVWQAICPGGIAPVSATVVCRELGYDLLGSKDRSNCAISSQSYCSHLDEFLPQILDPSSFPVDVLYENTYIDGRALWFPNILRCSGSESRLSECPVEPLAEEGTTPEQAEHAGSL